MYSRIYPQKRKRIIGYTLNNNIKNTTNFINFSQNILLDILLSQRNIPHTIFNVY